MSQHEEQCRHSRSWNKRLFTMNPVSPPTPRLLPVWAGLLLAAFSGVLMACAFIPVDSVSYTHLTLPTILLV